MLHVHTHSLFSVTAVLPVPNFALICCTKKASYATRRPNEINSEPWESDSQAVFYKPADFLSSQAILR